jgi:hypothetical protein
MFTTRPKRWQYIQQRYSAAVSENGDMPVQGVVAGVDEPTLAHLDYTQPAAST